MTTHFSFRKETAAGAFVLAGVALLAYGIFTLGKKEGYAEDKYRLYVLFKDIRGLSQGAAVRAAGVDVGSVSDIRFTEDRGPQEVMVTLTILKRLQKQIRANSLIGIATEGVLGNQYIAINPSGKENPPFPDGAIVVGQEPFGFREIAAQLQPLLKEFTATIVSLKNTSDQVAGAFQDVSSSATDTLGSVEELSESLSDSGKKTLASLKDTTEAYGRMSPKVEAALESLTETSETLRRLLNRIEKKVVSGKMLSVF
jgi:phospholipid/cholesterol/gamma-HCH transport system substrate-binding protein